MLDVDFYAQNLAALTDIQALIFYVACCIAVFMGFAKGGQR
jgi:hypothetical protein